MIKNYIVIAWRSLLKHKLFSFINIFGLALSMSVCMIVLMRVVDAFDYDNFHPGNGTIYRILSKIENTEGKTWRMASTPLPLATELQHEAPENAAPSTQLYPAIQQTAKDGSREFQVNGIFAQPSFFSIFGFKLKYGDATSALARPKRVLLSEKTARKFYGELDPTGKTITLGTLGEFEIAGVVKNSISKSHISYDVIASLSTVPSLERAGLLPGKYEVWDSFELAYTYVAIADHQSKTAMEARLARIAAGLNKNSQSGSYSFELQPLSAITPGESDLYHEIGRGPSRGSLMAEGGIALIILLAACFNYTNLSVARSLTRGKEVGIRKLSGAQRWQIFAQYITEAVIIALLALFLANVILAPILEFKPFNDGYEMVPAVVPGFKLFLVFIAFSVFAGILAGAVPAWLISAFKPARVIGGLATEKLMGSFSLRKALMVFQFSLSLVILIFLSTFYRQFNFIAEADPGFSCENIVLIPAGSKVNITATAFSKFHGVSNIGFTSDAFGAGSPVSASRQARDADAVSMEQYACDNHWIDMMKLDLIAGTKFHSESDSSVLINEKAARMLGFADAADAVGSFIYIQDSIRTTVTGVVVDFYSQGYGNPIPPLLLRNIKEACKFIAVSAEQPSAGFIASLEQEWKKQNTGHGFEYTWLDKKMKEQNDQSAEISLLGFLGFMTVTIASLGLLGLVVYTVETRRKEISVRKIIGASVREIVALLSAGFMKLLILSGIVALPIGYVLSKIFLTNFVNQVPLGILGPLLCFGFLFSIGLVTILSQTWKASTENPARNLRSE